LIPYFHHFSFQILAPGNRTERFGNVFSPHILFLLTATLAPTAIEIWTMPEAPLAPAIPLPAGFHFKVQGAFAEVGLGQRFFSFLVHCEPFYAVIYRCLALGCLTPARPAHPVSSPRRSSSLSLKSAGQRFQLWPAVSWP